MIESLAEHGVDPSDLVPALMTTHTVKNPEYDPAAATRKDVDDEKAMMRGMEGLDDEGEAEIPPAYEAPSAMREGEKQVMDKPTPIYSESALSDPTITPRRPSTSPGIHKRSTPSAMMMRMVSQNRQRPIPPRHDPPLLAQHPHGYPPSILTTKMSMAISVVLHPPPRLTSPCPRYLHCPYHLRPLRPLRQHRPNRCMIQKRRPHRVVLAPRHLAIQKSRPSRKNQKSKFRSHHCLESPPRCLRPTR